MELGFGFLLLSLSLTGLTGLSSRPSQAWDVVSPRDKTLYVDLSLCNMPSEERTYSFSYVVEEVEYEIELLPLNHDIYQTKFFIPASVLALSSPEFIVHAYQGEEEVFHIELGEHPFALPNYDYVCLDEEGVIGYGYYKAARKNPGATYATQRVFLVNDNEAFYGLDEWGSTCINAVGYQSEGGYDMVAMDMIPGLKSGKDYYFADIPEEVTSLEFLCLSSGENHGYLHYASAAVTSLSYGVCYYAGVGTLDDYSKVKTDIVEDADAGMIATVVESYLTYGKGDANGCTELTVSNLYNTWFARKAATSEELKATKILDYTGYSANGNSYVGLEKTSSFSVNEKWNTMCSQAGIDPNTGKKRSFFSFLDFSNPILLIVLVVGVGAVVSLGVMLYMLKKKKQGKYE